MAYIQRINDIFIGLLRRLSMISLSDIRSSEAYGIISDYLHTTVGMGVSLVFVLLTVIAIWRILHKAGEPGWVAIIPIVNLIYLFKITFGSGWFFILTLIPIINVIVGIIFAFRLSHSFGHGFLFALGLLFFPAIFIWILGFSGAYYLGPNGK